jgi:hypothetical protein
MNVLSGPTCSRIAFLLSLSLAAAPAHAYDYSRSVQNVLNGASSVGESATYGKGIVFAVIDTGVISSWKGFSSSVNGQGVTSIKTSYNAACLSTACRTSTTLSDTNGHGTFVASEIVGAIPSAGVISIAPAATAFSVDVLDGSSGTANDIAKGIVYAVNKGAQVLNVSLGPTGGTSSEQATFYKTLASAVNYAATKNAVIVLAGGNNVQDFARGATITGFSDAALKRILLMGSTNANKQLSSFSNKPGVGYFLSTSGKKYYYENMWLMADGENIWGASTTYGANGYTYIKQMSGTSMTAPQGAGAVGLVEAKWPILIKNGNATSLLETTASNMGGSDINRTYGHGFLDLVKAFQPVGTLTVTTTAGKSVPVSSVTSSMVSSGALGNVSTVKSKLSNYTAFDGYKRNFTVNLSGALSAKKSSSSTAASATAASVTSSRTKFSDGSSLAYASASAPSRSVTQIDDQQSRNWSMSFTDASGSTLAAGNGFPASASFTEALWGDSSFSREATAIGASNALTDLASGGTYAAYGTALDVDTRIAFAYTQSQPINATVGTDWTTPSANAFSAGVIEEVTEAWKAGLTVSILNEEHGLLGTTYATDGLLGFGNENNSVSVGISSAFDLSEDSALMFDAVIARSGETGGNGLVADVSTLYATSYGAAFVQNNIDKEGDMLSLSLRSPLRVFSGSASLRTTGVDSEGEPVYGTERVGLTPSGHEIDLALGYQRPLDEKTTLNFSLQGRHEPNNVAGTADVAIMFGGRTSF